MISASKKAPIAIVNCAEASEILGKTTIELTGTCSPLLLV